MKWDKKQVDILKNGYQQFIKNCGYTLQELRDGHSGHKNPLWIMYCLDRLVVYDLQNSNSHPAYKDTEQEGVFFKARIRRVKYNPEFVLYPPGCNDRHKDTVLKSIGKELKLID